MSDTEEAKAYAVIRELGEQLAIGGLSDKETAALRARRNRLRDEWGNPPETPPPAAPAALSPREVELRGEDDKAPLDFSLVPQDRATMWRQLAECNGHLIHDSVHAKPDLNHQIRRQRDILARKLGLAA